MDKILAAWRDGDGADRLHAVETLAELGVSILREEPALTEDILRGETNRISVYTLWGVSLDSVRYHREFKPRQVVRAIDAPVKGSRMEDVLAEQGTGPDTAILTTLLDNIRPLNSAQPADTAAVIALPENADVRFAAAFAILQTARRLDEAIQARRCRRINNLSRHSQPA